MYLFFGFEGGLGDDRYFPGDDVDFLVFLITDGVLSKAGLAAPKSKSGDEGSGDEIRFSSGLAESVSFVCLDSLLVDKEQTVESVREEVPNGGIGVFEFSVGSKFGNKFKFPKVDKVGRMNGMAAGGDVS